MAEFASFCCIQAMGPFSAYAQLLQHWVPLLLAELDGCAEFLMLKEDATAATAAGLGGHGENPSSLIPKP